MKKTVRAILIILLIIIVLGIIFFTIDYVRIKQNKMPVFCINPITYRDGGTKEFYGLGYKVIAFNKMLAFDTQISEMNYYKDIKIGTWFMKYQK